MPARWKRMQKKYGEPTPQGWWRRCPCGLSDQARFPVFKSASKPRIFMRRATLLARRSTTAAPASPKQCFAFGTVKPPSGSACCSPRYRDLPSVFPGSGPVRESKVGVLICSKSLRRVAWYQFNQLPSVQDENFDVIKTMNKLEARPET